METPGAPAVVPDGFFGLEYSVGGRKTYRFIALELDRGTMPVTRSGSGQTSYFGKLSAYRNVIARQAHKFHLGISSMLVLTLTTSKGRAEQMMKSLGGDAGTNAVFLFRALDGASLSDPALELLTSPWMRAELHSLQIDQ